MLTSVCVLSTYFARVCVTWSLCVHVTAPLAATKRNCEDDSIVNITCVSNATRVCMLPYIPRAIPPLYQPNLVWRSSGTAIASGACDKTATAHEMKWCLCTHTKNPSTALSLWRCTPARLSILHDCVSFCVGDYGLFCISTYRLSQGVL